MQADPVGGEEEKVAEEIPKKKMGLFKSLRKGVKRKFEQDADGAQQTVTDIPDSSMFGMMPDEVVDFIFSYLQATELSRTGATCRRLRQRSQNPRLWRRLFLLDFHAASCSSSVVDCFPRSAHLFGQQRLHSSPPSFNLIPPPPGFDPLPPNVRPRPPPPPPPSFMRFHRQQHLRYHQSPEEASVPQLILDMRTAKASYIKRLKEVDERKKERDAERLRIEIREKRARRRKQIGQICEVFGTRGFVFLFGVCTLALLGLIVTKLNNPEAANWDSVLIPLWVLFTFVAIGITVDTLLYWKRADPDSVLHALWESHLGISSGWVNEIAALFEGRKRLLTILCGYGAIITIVLFVILIAVKLGPSSSFSWTEAFIPSWLTLLIISFALAPAYKDASKSEVLEFAAAFIALLLPFLIFLILLPLYLDGSLQTSLEVVMVPLWLQDGVYIIGFAAHCIHTGLAAGELKEILANVFYIFAAWCLAAPIIVFQALICVYVKDNASVTPGGLFAPLFLWFSALTFISLFGLCMCDGDIVEDEPPPQVVFAPPRLQSGGTVTRSSAVVGSPGSRGPHGARRRHHDGELVRTHGTRNIQQELLRTSWAHSANPQFDMDAFSDAWDHLVQTFTDDAVNEEELNEFQRMQLAISRALTDLYTRETPTVPATTGPQQPSATTDRAPTPPPPGFLNRQRLEGVQEDGEEEEDDRGDVEAQNGTAEGALASPRTPPHSPPSMSRSLGNREEDGDDEFLPLPPHPPPMPPREPPPPTHPPRDELDIV